MTQKGTVLVGLATVLFLIVAAPLCAASPHAALMDSETRLNLDAFLIPTPAKALTLRVGHHQPVSQGLLFKGQSHWGVSAAAQFTPLNAAVSVFGAHEAAGGPDEPVSLFDGSDYFTGGNVRARLPVPWVNMTLKASYVMGRESDVESIGDQEFGRPVGEGLGYSVGMDTVWFNDRLRLELERARTQFSHEKTIQSDRSESDKAHRARLTYRPDLGSVPLEWKIGAESLNVGPEFRSPANQGLSRNRSMDRIFTRISPGDIWSLGYSYQQSGESGSGPVPETRGNEVSADLNLALDDNLHLQPHGAFERETNPRLGVTAYHSLWRLRLDNWLIPGQLYQSHTLGVNATRSQNPSVFRGDRAQRYLASELKWQALRPARHRPGIELNLSIRADELRTEGSGSSDSEDYRVLLSIRSSRY